MKTTHILVTVALMIATMGCGSSKKTTDGNGVYVGQPISEFLSIFKGKYKVEKGTIEVNDFDAYHVFENNEKLFSVELDGSPDVVSRIWIYSPLLKTEKGIGIGSTLAELRSKYEISGVSEFEQQVWVQVDELSATFRVIFVENFDIQNFDIQANFLVKASRGEMPTPAEIYTFKDISVWGDHVMITTDKRIIVRNADETTDATTTDHDPSIAEDEDWAEDGFEDEAIEQKEQLFFVTENDWEGVKCKITIQIDGQPQRTVTAKQYFEFLYEYHSIPVAIEECVFPNATLAQVYNIVNKPNLQYLQEVLPTAHAVFSYEDESITVTYDYKSEKHLYIEMLWVHSGGGFTVEIIEQDNETKSKVSTFAP